MKYIFNNFTLCFSIAAENTYSQTKSNKCRIKKHHTEGGIARN